MNQPTTPTAVNWDDRACADTDDYTWSLFFPGGGNEDRVNSEYVIKTFCRRCPIKDACLRFAIETDDRAGIMGGTTPSTRNRWTTEQRATRLETVGGDASKLRAAIDARPTRSTPECGTYSGYSQHRKDKTRVCVACREAGTAYQRDYRARQASA